MGLAIIRVFLVGSACRQRADHQECPLRMVNEPVGLFRDGLTMEKCLVGHGA